MKQLTNKQRKQYEKEYWALHKKVGDSKRNAEKMLCRMKDIAIKLEWIKKQGG